MKSFRSISTCALALALLIALLAPAPARAQHVKVFDGLTFAAVVPAPAGKRVRLTVLHPKFLVPTGPAEAQVDYFLKLQGVDGDISSATIAPGTAFKVVIDPRTNSRAAEDQTGVHDVVVNLLVVARSADGKAVTPHPAVTIELIDDQTGESSVVYTSPATMAVRVGSVDR